jgi:hypothetical protein
MPSLSDTLRSSTPEGYAPAQPVLALPSPVAMPGNNSVAKINPFIRCPLPPINAGPDTLRQFNENSDVPHRRVLPLPANSGLGGGTTVNNTTVVNQSGGGAATPTEPTLMAVSVSYTTPILVVGGQIQQTLAISSKSFQLISCTSTAPCEVRLYGSSIAQITDSSRATDVPLAAELNNNIISDIVLDTAPYVWYWQNRIGANSDTPQTTSLYMTVINLSANPVQPTLTFVMLPLES